ncbi:Six-hairpin glycosidase-like protein [Halenospora varia]|nr:Six-hairpin glycosidase-like protein [Halenospora varia]
MAAGTWIWHPEWKDGPDESSAGGFVHFRRTIHLTAETLPSHPVKIQISADTKYKLYINSRLVSIGPVKGDEHLWFFDEVDIQPYLRIGQNHFNVRVLRWYYATLYAASFPRLPYAGLLIRSIGDGSIDVDTGNAWETAIDLSTRLPIDNEEDAFLHVYENVDSKKDADIKWVTAKKLNFPASNGESAPWKLSPRMIPTPKYQSRKFKEIHNIRSSESQSSWENVLLSSTTSLRLPAGTSHHVELEAEHHITAFLDFKFERPANSGSTLKVTYSECYEDQPEQIPWVRCKGDRRDTTKTLLGPEDKYGFGGKKSRADLPQLHERTEEEEIFTPFYFRTLRFIALDILVAEDCDLVINGIDITTTNYPLEVLADFKTPNTDQPTEKLWTTSIRTLENCMHDCYEDCPFYEQLQYAMDIRSSALFTYVLSGDDRLARQAIIQVHNSYNTNTGLTASRAPAHKYQIIPNFSLYWICMVTDHFEYFGDSEFVRQFMPACDGVFESFGRRVGPEVKLVRSLDAATTALQWDFVDWTPGWRPFGIPPAGERTGYLSFTNMLYAYSLKRAAKLLESIGRPALASEYLSRADSVVAAVQKHCFDGNVFTDGLASMSKPEEDMSQHSQVWAVLCGAAVGEQAQNILRTSLSSPNFTVTSVSMSFYTLRALSLAGGNLYNDSFHAFWNPWREQLAQGLTTWVEEDVSQRSDCHAWGSAPIYEFLVEVVGIRPREKAWGVVGFEPRVGLFTELEARVPFGVGEKKGVALVKWKKEGEKFIVHLEMKMDSGEGEVLVRESKQNCKELENVAFEIISTKRS